MFLFPIGTSVAIHRIPWVTYALAAINVAVYLLFNVRILATLGQFSLNEFIHRWGYVAAAPSWTTALASMFIHGSTLHLLSNVWFLLLFGRVVEDRLGSILYALLYVVSGFGATLLQSAFLVMGDRGLPQIGASGAIFGVMGALLVVAFWAEFRFFYFFIIRVGAVRLISFWICLYYVGLNLIASLIAAQMHEATGGGVAVFAHVGGFFSGLGIALALRYGLPFLLPREGRPDAEEETDRVHRRIRLFGRREESAGSTEHRAAAHLLRLMYKGRTDLASDQYVEYVGQYPDLTLPPAQMCELAECVERAGHRAHARHAYERVVSTVAHGQERMQSLLGLARLCAEDRRFHAEGLHHLRELLAHDPPPDMRREANLLMMRLSGEGAEEEDRAPSPLTQELEARVQGQSRPAYIPDPLVVEPVAAAPEVPAWEPRSSLPPPRPGYIEETTTPAESEATFAVVLTGHQRIDVPKVARVVARVAGRSMIDTAAVISQGMGMVLETSSRPIAAEAARQLTILSCPAAVVDLTALPEQWELIPFVSAAVVDGEVQVVFEQGDPELLRLADLLTIAHAAVARSPSDPNPELVCDLLLLSPPRRFRARQSAFRHATAGAPEALRSFVLLLGQRAARAQRDAGLVQSLSTNQAACLRFASLELFEKYQRWLTLCAFAGR